MWICCLEVKKFKSQRILGLRVFNAHVHLLKICVGFFFPDYVKYTNTNGTQKNGRVYTRLY
jgi:hypothetical protein